MSKSEEAHAPVSEHGGSDRSDTDDDWDSSSSIDDSTTPLGEAAESHCEEHRPSTSTFRSIQVHREEITPTIVREGNEELEDLDVEAYDQQTYEKGVFEQVNKAISTVDGDKSNCSDAPKKSPIDIMQLIHHQNDQDLADDQAEVPVEQDEHVLQLTRLERLNKTVKREAIDDTHDCNQSTSRLPKIPRLSNRVKVQESDPTVNVTNRPEVKTEPPSYTTEIADQDEPELNQSLDASFAGYYQPLGSSKKIVKDEESTDEEFDADIDYETDSDLGADEEEHDKRRARRKTKKNSKKLEDDGDFRAYESRIKSYTRDRAKLRLENISEDGNELMKLDELIEVEGKLKIPKELWDNLFEHQKTGVRWLWELHQLGTGGILGDEMGLGKTIQMIAFLTALRSSNVMNMHKKYENLGPTVLVCPATVMHQWLFEFRKWWPPFRVAILHNTGTFTGNKRDLVQAINKSRGVLIVSFPGVVIYQDYLHAFDWHYAILDEGHKIRNPDAQVTLACKRFRTPHRLILSGSPVQNNLKELWSIFDFIYPGKLGTLPVFMEQFAIPITQGGYANASDIQVQIAYKCTCILRDSIKPFLLRRTKAEVNHKLKLPDRSEQVLFCKLTEKQRKLYQAYLESPTVRDIKNGFCQIFVGLIQLRKICNHPDLFDASECQKQLKKAQDTSGNKHSEFFSEDETFGHYKKCGKMMVVEALLKLWKQQNHKVLLFTQSRQMIKIFSNYLNERNYKYLTMDGTTPIGIRQTMIEEYNKNDEIFIFLLTTRVGGVGINLTGADRIIIYDPDWNPSTDIQARERAWRIGQQRHVIIYRLLTAGTIEEKIYHRQVFKLYLTNRVLKNAQQKRFFKTNDLHELFTLGDNDKNIETKALFDDDLQINPETIKRSKKRSKEEKKRKKREKKARKSVTNENSSALEPARPFSDEKLKAMREHAKRLSQMIRDQYGSQAKDNLNSGVKVKTEPGILSQPVEQVPKDRPRIDLDELLVPNRSRTTLDKNGATNGQSSSTGTVIKKEPTHVEYLVKQDVYQPDTSESKPDPRYKRDDYILERLFKSSNIFGALKHDKIETDSTADFKVVESEAEKVARDAIRALRESRRLCLNPSLGIPNWTGQNGQLARARAQPRSRPKTKFLSKLGSSSNEPSLLSSITKRNQINPVPLERTIFNRESDSEEEERNKDFEGKAAGTGAEVMVDKVREFIMYQSAQPGEVQTDEILTFFKNNFKPDLTPVFKAVLYKMCEFQRRGDKGFWLIRREFRDM